MRDRSGEKFGKLTIISFVGKDKSGNVIWRCRCDCGVEVNVLIGNLISGRQVSCGCYNREIVSKRSRADLVGKRFGRLTVSSLSRIDNRNQCIWRCVCDCSGETETSGYNLINGQTTSCGCYQRECATKNATTHGLSKTKAYKRFSQNRRRELQNELDCGWSPEMESALRELFTECVWCGGIDKLATAHVRPLSRGYGLIPGNASILCIHCNSRQFNKLPEEMSTEECSLILESAELFRLQWMD